jgi:sugar transferase (PEP-CTERM/EpsH1 system associated)
VSTSAASAPSAARLGHGSSLPADVPRAVPPAAVRVMHVMFALQPGGMEFGVIKIVNGLNPSRVRSSICSTAPAVGPMKSHVAPHVPVFELRRRAGNDPKLVWDLYRLFTRERPHVVHTHAWGTLLEGLLAARLARVPIVVHGEHGTLQLRGYQARIQRWAWGRTTAVLSVSRKLAERMARGTGFPHERIVTIQNGVDFSRFSPSLREAARHELGLAPMELTIGTAGRLVPVKDHANLIEALAILRDRDVAFTAVIAGEGPLRAEIEALIAARGLRTHVRLLGQRADVNRVFAALDVFVLPSKSEGMSNTILEAMASGVPTVATNVGGAEELVDDGVTGLLVPSQNCEALAGALGRMAASPGRRRAMGEAARVKAETEFSLDRMLGDYDALYVELAARAAGGHRS